MKWIFSDQSFNILQSQTLDLIKQANLLLILTIQNNWIQTSETGGQLHSDIFSYEVIKCSLLLGVFELSEE